MKIAAFYENIYDGVQRRRADMEETLGKLQDAGMELLYLSADSWRRDEKTLRPILRRLRMGIEGMHAFCDFPGDPDTQLYRELIDLAVDAEAGNLLLVPGFLTGGNSARDMQAILNGMKKAVAYGREKGLPVLMEDFDGLLSPYNSIFGLQYFLDGVDGLGCAFDTGNFAIFHEDELEAFELFADKIVTVHLKDRTFERRHPGNQPLLCADQREIFVCPIGSGDIRMQEILRGLKQRNYPGNVIVELYCCDPDFVLEDIVRSIRWVKNQVK